MIDFLKFKFVYLGISAVVIAIGLFSIASYGYKYSIDFTGGSVIEYVVPSSVQQKITKPRILKIEKNNVEIKSIEHKDGLLHVEASPIDDKVEALVRKELFNKTDKVKLVRLETVGPSLGKETVRKTAIASIVAILGILLYITYVFKKFSYGLAAILALLHDLLVLIGIYALISHFFGAEVDGLFITAVLTTMSFSVHDTIVVCDKIREYRRTSGYSIEVLANKALTETMVRSLNNSLTIILMLIPLVVMGSPTIRFFAAALLVGTISGTYSSPFVATPILVMLEKKK